MQKYKTPRHVCLRIFGSWKLKFKKLFFFVCIADDTDVDVSLQGCSSILKDLTLCLSEERSLIFKVHTCDELMAKTVTCLLMDQDTWNAHAQSETDVHGGHVVLKRGLGRCIHRCLNGWKQMNFIQCKSMCYRWRKGKQVSRTNFELEN